MSNEINTSCEKCIFAKFDSENRQIGCKADRLDKFVERGVKLDLLKNEDKESYIIKNRICLMCCTEQTVQQLQLKNPLLEMRKRIALKSTIYVLADEEHNLDDIKITLYSLIDQFLKPTEIVVILHSQTISRPALSKFLLELEEDNKWLAWRISHIHECGDNGEKPSREWCLDHTIKTCKTLFYGVFLAGFQVPNEYLSNIDYSLNDELHRFVVLRPADGYWNGAFVHISVHKNFHGNVPEMLEQYEDGELVATSIMDKVDYAAKRDNQLDMIRGVEEICPAMKQYKLES